MLLGAISLASPGYTNSGDIAPGPGDTGIGREVPPLSETELQSIDLLELLQLQVADLKRLNEIYRERVVLRDDLIASQQVRIQGLEAQLDTERRLSDAKIEFEKVSCSCPPLWQRRILNAGMLAVGGFAGRGTCGLD